MDKNINNTVITENNIEVYTDKIFYYSDEYISLYCDDIKELNFNHMILYIFDNIKPIDTNDINIIKDIFNAYYILCIKYKHNPTFEMFSTLLGIHSSTISKWISGSVKGKSHNDIQTLKEMKNRCKTALIDDLTNSSNGNVNKIFIAKACYGMTEIAPVSMEYLDKKYKSIDELPDFRQIAQQKKLEKQQDVENQT